jgi:hypothetical protein
MNAVAIVLLLSGLVGVVSADRAAVDLFPMGVHLARTATKGQNAGSQEVSRVRKDASLRVLREAVGGSYDKYENEHEYEWYDEVYNGECDDHCSLYFVRKCVILFGYDECRKMIDDHGDLDDADYDTYDDIRSEWYAMQRKLRNNGCHSECEDSEEMTDSARSQTLPAGSLCTVYSENACESNNCGGNGRCCAVAACKSACSEADGSCLENAPHWEEMMGASVGEVEWRTLFTAGGSYTLAMPAGYTTFLKKVQATHPSSTFVWYWSGAEEKDPAGPMAGGGDADSDSVKADAACEVAGALCRSEAEYDAGMDAPTTFPFGSNSPFSGMSLGNAAKDNPEVKTLVRSGSAADPGGDFFIAPSTKASADLKLHMSPKRPGMYTAFLLLLDNSQSNGGNNKAFAKFILAQFNFEVDGFAKKDFQLNATRWRRNPTPKSNYDGYRVTKQTSPLNATLDLLCHAGYDCLVAGIIKDTIEPFNAADRYQTGKPKLHFMLVGPLVGLFYINADNGEILGRIPDLAELPAMVTIGSAGSFELTLKIADESGAEDIVERIRVTIELADSSEPTNGPNGKGCGDHGTPIDDPKSLSDGVFRCNCEEGWGGRNCLDDKVAQAAATKAAAATIAREQQLQIGAPLGSVLVIILVVIGLFKLRAYRKSVAPFDFQAELDRLVESGALAANHLHKELTPREIPRKCVTTTEKVGEGAFGEVFKGTVLVFCCRHLRSGMLVDHMHAAVKPASVLSHNALLRFPAFLPVLPYITPQQ